MSTADTNIKPSSWKRRGSSKSSIKSKWGPRAGPGKKTSHSRARAVTEPVTDRENELAAILGGRRKRLDEEMSSTRADTSSSISKTEDKPESNSARHIAVAGKHKLSATNKSPAFTSNKSSESGALSGQVGKRDQTEAGSTKCAFNQTIQSFESKSFTGESKPPPKPKRLYLNENSLHPASGNNDSSHNSRNKLSPNTKEFGNKSSHGQNSLVPSPKKTSPPVVLPKPPSQIIIKGNDESSIECSKSAVNVSTVSAARSIFEKKKPATHKISKPVTKQKPHLAKKPPLSSATKATQEPRSAQPSPADRSELSSDSGNGSVADYDDVAFSPTEPKSEDEGWVDEDDNGEEQRRPSWGHVKHHTLQKNSVRLRLSAEHAKKRNKLISQASVTKHASQGEQQTSDDFYEDVDGDEWETDESDTDDYELVESPPIVKRSSDQFTTSATLAATSVTFATTSATLATTSTTLATTSATFTSTSATSVTTSATLANAPTARPPVPARGMPPSLPALPAVPVPARRKVLNSSGLSSSEPVLSSSQPQLPESRRGTDNLAPVSLKDLSQSVPPPRPPVVPSKGSKADGSPVLPARGTRQPVGPPVPARNPGEKGRPSGKSSDDNAPPLPPRSMPRLPYNASDRAGSPTSRKKSVQNTGLFPPKKNKGLNVLNVSVPLPHNAGGGGGGGVDDGYLQPSPDAPAQGYLPMDGLDKPPVPPTPARNVRPASEPVDNYIDPLTELESLPQAPVPPARPKPPLVPQLSSQDRDVGGEADYLLLTDEMVGEAAQEEEEDKTEHRLSMTSSRFGDEPLYQIYHTGAVVRDVLEGSGEIDSDEDDYNDIYESTETVKSYMDTILSKGSCASKADSLPRQSSALECVGRVGAGMRKLWCEMPEVLKSGVLEKISTEEKRLQECLFEIITSEASYQKSLALLVSHFVKSPTLCPVTGTCIDQRSHHVLFSNIVAVRSASAKFLRELEALWISNVVIDIPALCNLLIQFSQEEFGVYVHYCSNQMYQERMLTQISEQSPAFVGAVRNLQAEEVCQGLTMQSFLSLPMQRITRLPLLVDAVCHRMDPSSQAYNTIKTCLAALQKLVKQCNEGARQMANIEQVTKIDSMLKFKNVKKIALVSQSRSLVKKGALPRLQKQASGLLDKFKKKETFHLFLFNDLLLITKKKSEEEFQVLEHASRISLHAEVIEDEDVGRVMPHLRGARNVFMLVLLEKQQEYVLACDTMSERMRWVEAVTPAQHTNEDEKIYEDWDCPQVQAVYRYVAEEPDELSLEEADVINVFRKMADGWYEGERIRDGERGWFPSNHVMEIHSAHIRAKNLRQRYRMMMAASAENK